MELKTVQEQLAAARGKLQAAATDAKTAQSSYEKLLSEHEELNSLLAGARTELTTARDLCENLQQRVRTAEESNQQALAAKEATEEELAQLRVSQEALTSNVNSITKTLAEVEAARAEALVEITNLRQQLDENEADADQNAAQHAQALEWQQQLLSLQAQHDVLQKRCESLQAEVDAANAKFQDANSRLEQEESAASRLADAEEEFHLAVEVLTEERDAARQKEEEYF